MLALPAQAAPVKISFGTMEITPENPKPGEMMTVKIDREGEENYGCSNLYIVNTATNEYYAPTNSTLTSQCTVESFGGGAIENWFSYNAPDIEISFSAPPTAGEYGIIPNGRQLNNFEGVQPFVVTNADQDSNGSASAVSASVTPSVVNGQTNGVTIVFSGIPDSKEYKFCLMTDQDECKRLEYSDDVPSSVVDEGGTKKITLYNVCGNGSDAVKVRGGDKNNDCDSNDDYFHEGNIYRVGIYVNDEDNYSQLAVAQFFVKHYYPEVNIGNALTIKLSGQDSDRPSLSFSTTGDGGLVDVPNNPPANPFSVFLKGRKMVGGGDRNNYQLVVEGVDNPYGQSPGSNENDEGEKCVTVKEDGENGNGTSEVATFDYLQAPFQPGRYVLKVNERINEGGLIRDDKCQGGFTYYEIPFTVTATENAEGKTVLSTQVDTDNVEVDPNGSDIKRMKDLYPPNALPCAEGHYNKQTKQCDQIETALGNFSTDPMAFIGDIMRWVISIACLGAVAMLVYSGYLLIYSRGDKEKIQNAKDNIKALVIGLIFILLSVSIMQFIGIDILGLDFLSR